MTDRSNYDYRSGSRSGSRSGGRSRSSRSRYARSGGAQSGGAKSGGAGDGREKNTGELQQAVDRFEQAVQELVGSATTEFSDRATSFLNETTSKLEREFGRGEQDGEYGSPGDYADADYDESDAATRMAARRRQRARARSDRVLERSARLERDDDNAKIVGVCAGIANYYGVDAWVVRCIAVTGLLFFGSIVFPAYWIMYFVMDGPGSPKKGRGAKARSKRRFKRSRSRNEEAEMESVEPRERSIAPRRNLRNVQADLQEVELRLRRMETHVTSGQYELQRELHKIESEDSAAGLPGR